MLSSYLHFSTLAETDRLRLAHFHEETALIDKRTGSLLLEDDFYGNPDCGVISPTSDWAVVAGEHVTVWREGKKAVILPGLHWVHAMRVVSQAHILLLIDPWGEQPAIWRLCVPELTIQKVRDFPDY